MTSNPIGVLWADDVARILTEEAQAKQARRILTRKLQPAVDTAADLLPSEPLHTPPDTLDQAVADLKTDLYRWVGTKVNDDTSEDNVADIITDLLDRTRTQVARLDTFDPDNPHVKAARRVAERIGELVTTEWAGRKRATVSRSSVWAYVDKSHPATPTVDRPRRYIANPIPPPLASRDRDRVRGVEQARGRRRGERAMWYVSQEPDLRTWYRNLPGPGVGGGRPWHKNTDKREDPTS